MEKKFSHPRFGLMNLIQDFQMQGHILNIGGDALIWLGTWAHMLVWYQVYEGFVNWSALDYLCGYVLLLFINESCGFSFFAFEKSQRQSSLIH
jgi:hypothetical protein